MPERHHAQILDRAITPRTQQGTITAAGNRAITEVGVFDASTNGDMGIYGDFSVINLAASDSITFTLRVVLDQE